MHKIGVNGEQNRGKETEKNKGNKGREYFLTPSTHTHWQMHLTQNPATWKKP